MKKIRLMIINLSNQRGAALPLVLIFVALAMILSVAAIEVSQGNQGLIAHAITNDQAYYAAEKGYNKAMWQLNNEGYEFPRNIDPNPEKITFNSQPHNKYELPDGDNYRLNILVPLETVSGMTELQENHNKRIIRSTGWDTKHPEQLRTIEVEVFKKSFTQYVVANDSEKTEDGTPLYWTTDEKLYGPFHTNDTLYVSGYPTFYGPVTYVNGISITPAENINNPAIFTKGNAKVTETLSMPASTPELLAHARINGHYYNGRTCIYLKGNKYDVRTYDSQSGIWYYNDTPYEFKKTKKNGSTWSLSELEKEAANSSNETMFYDLKNNLSYSSFKDFAASISSRDLPPNGVIYVDGSPGDGSTGEYLHQKKYDPDLANVFIGGKLNGRLTVGSANDIYIVGHDPTDWSKPSYSEEWYDSTPGVTYSDTDFEQIFNGDDWSHTKVTGTGKDMLGLAAKRQVIILHYNWPAQYDDATPWTIFDCDNYCWTFLNTGFFPLDKAPENIKIYAALYAGDKHFGFEAVSSWRNKGTATLVGSITQKYRGQMGVSGWLWSGGYKKSYSHDPRMLYESPPFFPEPSNSGWKSTKWSESSNHIQ